MRKTMSDKGVAALRPRDARYSVSDPELNGLWIRVAPPGTKSYATVARGPTGEQIWLSIGTTDAMRIEEAREVARKVLQRVRAGLRLSRPRPIPLARSSKPGARGTSKPTLCARPERSIGFLTRTFCRRGRDGLSPHPPP